MSDIHACHDIADCPHHPDIAAFLHYPIGGRTGVATEWFVDSARDDEPGEFVVALHESDSKVVVTTLDIGFKSEQSARDFIARYLVGAKMEEAL